MKKTLYFLLFFISTNVYANIVMTGSRIVYEEGKPFVNVQLNNKSNKVFFVQSWIENSEASPKDITETAYAVIPPIVKLKANSGQVIRISLLDNQAFPEDRESVSYFNFLQVPANTNTTHASKESNKLVITIKHKVKLFYRPNKIANYKKNWMQDIHAEVIEHNNNTLQLRITNNMPLYLSMSDVAKLNSGDSVYTSAGQMIAPYSYQDFEFMTGIENNFLSTPANLIFSSVNDQGGLTEREYTLYF